jgi:hypothetical protein
MSYKSEVITAVVKITGTGTESQNWNLWLASLDAGNIYPRTAHRDSNQGKNKSNCSLHSVCKIKSRTFQNNDCTAVKTKTQKQAVQAKG